MWLFLLQRIISNIIKVYPISLQYFKKHIPLNVCKGIDIAVVGNMGTTLKDSRVKSLCKGVILLHQ